VHLLRRFLRRFCISRVRARCSPFEVCIRNVYVMPHGYGLRIAQPFRHDRQWELARQVRFTTCPHRMP
jgi:hypothetical protein